jgi:hypothetical protein
LSVTDMNAGRHTRKGIVRSLVDRGISWGMNWTLAVVWLA